MVKVRLGHYTKCQKQVDGDEHGPAALNMVKVRLGHNTWTLHQCHVEMVLHAALNIEKLRLEQDKERDMD